MGIIWIESLIFTSSWFKNIHSPLGVNFLTVFYHIWPCEEVLIQVLMSQTRHFLVVLHVIRNTLFRLMAIVAYNTEKHKRWLHRSTHIPNSYSEELEWVCFLFCSQNSFHNWKYKWNKLSYCVLCIYLFFFSSFSFHRSAPSQNWLSDVGGFLCLIWTGVFLPFKEKKNEMAMEAILLMFLSILWLTSIIHNSSIDIASCPMDPLTWFNVSWNASYIINTREFS